MQHGAGAQEQQALEEGVAGHVVQRRRQRQRRHRLHAVGREQHRQPDGREQQADVLDRRIGQQPLHVDLRRGKHHAEQRAGQPQPEQQHAPPPDLHMQQVERDPQHAVHGRFQHHPAHERRDRRRRRRMRLGQPDVQRHQAGLGAEPEQRQQERHRGPERRVLLRPHVGEGVVAGVGLQYAEAQQDADGPDVRDQQVEVAGPADLGQPVVGDDQEERGQGHRLPHHHERIGVVGQHHHRHAGQEHVVLETQQAGRRALALAEVAGRKRGHAGQRQGRDDRRAEGGAQRQGEQHQRDHAAGGKQHSRHQRQPAESEQSEQGHQQPAGNGCQHPVEMEPERRTGNRGHGSWRALAPQAAPRLRPVVATGPSTPNRRPSMIGKV